MGADMLVYAMATRKDKLDWDAGHAILNGLDLRDDQVLGGLDDAGIMADYEDNDGDYDDLYPAQPDLLRQTLNAFLDELQATLEDQPRDVTYLDFGEWVIFLTGGMSWGDAPTDAAALFSRAVELDETTKGELYAAIGFGWPDDPKGP